MSLYDLGTYKSPNISLFKGSSNLGEVNLDNDWRAILTSAGNVEFYVNNALLFTSPFTHVGYGHLSATFGSNGYPSYAVQSGSNSTVVWYNGVWLSHTFAGENPSVLTHYSVVNDSDVSEIAVFYMKSPYQDIYYRLRTDSFANEYTLYSGLANPSYLIGVVPYTSKYRLFMLTRDMATKYILESELDYFRDDEDSQFNMTVTDMYLASNFAYRESTDNSQFTFTMSTMRLQQ